MENKEYQKKKKRKEQFRKFVINFFVWLIIIAFVTTLGVYWGDKQRVKIVKVAEINKKAYNYQPGAAFNYILNSVREAYNSRGMRNLDTDLVNKKALDSLVYYGVILDFAQKQKIEPSKDMLRAFMEMDARGRLSGSPDKGFVEYANMQYSSDALTGNYGDIANSTAMVTYPELYSYADLESFNAEAEFLYIDITNYIQTHVTDEDIKPFYLENISNYISEATVDEISMSNKSLSFEMAKGAQNGNWDKVIADNQGKFTRIENLVLKNTNGYAKRLAQALEMKPGDIVQKPLFENGSYRIFRLKSFPDLKSLTEIERKRLTIDFVNRNFQALRTKFDNDIKTSVSKAEEIVKSRNDFKSAVSSGMSYVKSGKVSPVSQYLIDDKKEIIPLPLLQNTEWIDFIFTADKNAISKTFYTDGYIVKIRQLQKGIGAPVSLQKMDQQTVYEYNAIKSVTVSKEWYDFVKSTYTTKTYFDDLKKMMPKE